MSCNLDLVSDILNKIRKTGYKINSLYPLHLAVACLDSLRLSCTILAKLTDHLPLTQHIVNDLGHTPQYAEPHRSKSPQTPHQNFEFPPKPNPETSTLSKRLESNAAV